MMERGSSGAGSVIGVVLLLAVLAWIVAVLGLQHMNMTNHEALGHRDAMYQITDELGLHRTDVEMILVPKFDGSLDIFINRAAFESVPYPDRDELSAAISDVLVQSDFDVLAPRCSFPRRSDWLHACDERLPFPVFSKHHWELQRDGSQQHGQHGFDIRSSVGRNHQWC
jgi:hypothetical protein